MSDYNLDLTATSVATADGVSVNSATAELMNGDQYVSGATIVFKIIGNAVFSNKSNSITTSTGATGAVSVIFTDTIAETVYITATLQSDASVSNTVPSTFSESSDGKYNLIFVVDNDNAKADGTQTNRLELNVRDKNTNIPSPNVAASFSITDGSAKFLNGSKFYTGTTDNNGSCYVSLTDTVVESVVVTASVGQATEVQTVTFTGGDRFRITDVKSMTNKKFSMGEPLNAWIGAKFEINVTGGSGNVTWKINGTGVSVQQTLRNGVVVQFDGNASVDCDYLVTGEDNKTGEKVTYEFRLSEFYVSFGSSVFIESLIGSGESKYLPSPAQLHALYGQWGTMAEYTQWTAKTDTYWTSDYNILTISTLVNLKTNEETSVLLNILQSHGFAKLSVPH